MTRQICPKGPCPHPGSSLGWRSVRGREWTMSVPALSLVDSEALPPAPSAPSLPAMSRLMQAVRDLAAARDLERIVEIVRH
eukprot:gene7389-8872_t